MPNVVEELTDFVGGSKDLAAYYAPAIKHPDEMADPWS